MIIRALSSLLMTIIPLLLMIRILMCEVAIKIIKSRKPFMLQAQTEIELLMLMLEKDR